MLVSGNSDPVIDYGTMSSELRKGCRLARHVAGSRPGRPRDPDVDRSILDATQDLLLERGYAGTTIADVAARAQCGKSAIYRRWSGKADLVVAAVLDSQVPALSPETGSLRGDLIAAAMHFAGRDDRAARVLATMLTALGDDDELRETASRDVGRPPVAAIRAVIERWIERGVVAPTVPVALLAGIIPTAAFGSVVLQRRHLDERAVTELVDAVVVPALLAV